MNELSKKSAKILIFDIRSAEEFNRQHIIANIDDSYEKKCNIFVENIPKEYINFFKNFEELKNHFSGEINEFGFEKRSRMKIIIIIDKNSELFYDESPVIRLADLLWTECFV